MPAPTDKQGVRRLLGTINYLQKFAPHLAPVTGPIRELMKDNVEFQWDETVHGKCFQEIRNMMSQTPVLRYFDPKIDVVIQCDASQHGLGACLMQCEQPVGYASRPLTVSETNYAQIEKELLAIVFAVQKFDSYVYGRKIVAESDHKPLETIMKKGLQNAPKRLRECFLANRSTMSRLYTRKESIYI